MDSVLVPVMALACYVGLLGLALLLWARGND